MNTIEHMDLRAEIVSGDEAAAQVAAELAAASVWFSFEPLPDGRYEFQVKSEHLFILEASIKSNAA